MYSSSSIGFTDNKISRLVLHNKVGLTSNKEAHIASSLYFKKVTALISEMPEDIYICKSIFLKDFSLKKPMLGYLISSALIEAGKIAKSALLLGSDTISFYDFIKRGQNLLFGGGSDCVCAPHDSFTLNLCRRFIDQAVCGTCGDLTLHKDASASAFQHWGIILGLRPGYSHILNFSGDAWVDPYSFFIKAFIREYGTRPNIEFIFKRQYLKKLIMTVGYNAREDTCRSYLYKELLKDSEYIGIDLIKAGREDINKTVSELYSFIKKDLFTLLYERDRVEALNSIKVDELVLEDATINLAYKKVSSKPLRKKYTYKYKSWYLNHPSLLNEADRRKQNISLEPNIIHAYDAQFARYIGDKVNCYSVHDSFSVSIYDLHDLMDTSNTYFRRKSSLGLGDDAYGTFILL